MNSQSLERILAMLNQSPESLEREQRWMARLRIIYAALALPAFLALDAYLAVQLLMAWRTHDWGSFWDAMKWGWNLLPFLGFSSVFYEIGRQARQARLLQAATTQRLARGETGADAQPEPLAGRDLPAGPEQIDPLERIERGRKLDLVKVLVISSLLAAGAVAALLIILLLAHLPTLADALFWVAILGVCGGPFAAATILTWIKLRRVREPLAIIADEWGLEWQTPTIRHKREHLAWHDAQTFFAIAEPQEDGSTHYSTYVLQGEKLRLVWTVHPRAETAMVKASGRLSRLIVTRTRLPLRVISAAALSPKEYDPRAPVPSPVDPPLGERAARFLRLAWLIPTVCTILITLAGLIVSHLPL